MCGICADPVDPECYAIDHIIPICKGGGHVWENLQIAHHDCNVKKGRKIAA